MVHPITVQVFERTNQIFSTSKPGLALGGGSVQAGFSAPVQGAHLRKEAIFSGAPLILIIPRSGLHMDLDQLNDEASTPIFTPVATSDSCSISSSRNVHRRFLLLQMPPEPH